MNSKMFLRGCLFGSCIGTWIMIFIMWWHHYPAIEKEWHDEAVKKGHAEYYVEVDIIKWRWLDHDKN